ncbi:MAG: 2-thiouracil desulfurase family protein [Oscillospiraceae bacterium]
MKLLVSACLLGVACRYDGRSKLHPLAQKLCRRHEVIPVCGEIFGGAAHAPAPLRTPGGRRVCKRRR